jgi:TetR/AcrR family transcriptional regulator
VTQARVFSAASGEFAERGYDGATLDRIAARAGCSKAIIIRHFGSKRELYRSVLNARYAELSRRETVREVPPDTPIERMLSHILADLFKFNADNPDFSRLLSWENLHGAAHLDNDAARAARQPGWERLVEMLRAAQDDGHIRRDLDLDWFVYVLQAITIVYFTNRHTMKVLTGTPFEEVRTMKRFIAQYSQLLAEGIASRQRKESQDAN